MRLGKIPENVWKRSILKRIKYKSPALLLAPAAGENCTRWSVSGQEDLVFTTSSIVGNWDWMGAKAFYRIANHVAAAGGVLSGITVSLLIPDGTEESGLREIMTPLLELAAQNGVDILGTHTEVSSLVEDAVLSLTGVGAVTTASAVRSGGLKPGNDIVMTKYAGATGIAELIGMAKYECLEKHFCRDFLERVMMERQYLSCVKDAQMAGRMGVTAMHSASDAGVFYGLWEIAEASGVGVEIDLKKIPIRQETIEISEVLDANPYSFSSDGVLLVGTPEGTRLVKAYAEEGIPAAVIGTVTENNDRVVINGEDRRFLTPPGRE